jgi:hypothetical protein
LPVVLPVGCSEKDVEQTFGPKFIFYVDYSYGDVTVCWPGRPGRVQTVLSRSKI